MSDRWPTAVWLVRHGESAGNVAAAVADATGQDVIDIAERDADVGLTERGVTQATAVGAHLLAMPAELRPTRALASPYLRARQTASISLESLQSLGGPGAVPVVIDERLRDRELGVLDRLTQRGIAHLHPDQAEARSRLGKFYHRPPGGESWVDVVLRLRGVVDTLRSECAGERVIVFTHDVVVMLFRYLFENLDEAALMSLGRRIKVVNGGITFYELDESGGMVLRQFNAVIGPDGRATAHEEEDHAG